MSVIQELSNITKLPIDELTKGYSIQILSGKAMNISNYKKILIYTMNRLVLSTNSGTVEVIGENIKISELDSGTITIKGKINSLSLGGK